MEGHGDNPQGGWRPFNQGVEEMLKEMEVKIGEDRVIIFYGMDNGVFYEEDDNVERSSPNQMQRGCIMKGKLVLATQKQEG